MISDSADPSLVQAARGGDREAFDRLFAAHVPKLRGVLRRLVGHPDEVDDLVQDSLLRAFQSLAGFRGEASPSTWLCAIGTRLALDHLRQRKRWRERAQVIYAAACLESETLGGEVGAALNGPGFAYDVREHIAYCFTCVGRTLEPEAQAALVQRDVLGQSNTEAAEALGLSHAVLRHRLAEARERMQSAYDGLCALVSKTGVCWQCAGLREFTAPDARGPEVPARLDWEQRMEIVRTARLDDGVSRSLHDLFFRRTEAQEQQGLGDAEASTDCGIPGEAAEA